jgi:hypothetical protein
MKNPIAFLAETVKQVFCRHGNMQTIEDDTWVHPTFACEHVYRERRKFLCCLQCGFTKKIAPK